jgi:isopenicillin N synthase-like dioxygenase
MPQTVEDIPLIDLAPWFHGSESDRAALAADVDAALSALGFLVVINHGIDVEVFSEARQACFEFFHRPVEEKSLTMTDGEAYRGWIGAGLESNAATYGIDTPPDLKETFAFGSVDLGDESLRDIHPIWHAPNAWPVAPANFGSAAKAFWRTNKALANELLKLMALALGLPVNTLLDQCRSTTSTGTFNWYWSHTHSAAVEGEYRIGPHTDFGTLTILDRQPGIGGLQVQNAAGDWIDAPVLDGSLIVNTGDMLRQWTNDRWCSNEHRVLPPSADAPSEELVSLIFFHEPDADAIIAPLETCVSPENPARHAPISSSDYLEAKFAALAVGDQPQS